MKKGKLKKIKAKNTILIFILLVLFVIIYFALNNRNILENEKILKQMYGNPISSDGVINNNYFNISPKGERPKETLEGINKAIEYADKNNIRNLKLEKGFYLIDSQIDEINYHYQEKGITLKSNMSLDLNSSTIKHVDCDRESYTLITLIDVNNVSIYNGILEGDRINHNYDSGGTHEFGHGIDIAGGKNIDIYNLEIKEMTGDGIYVTCKQIYDIPHYTQNVKIHNCNIYNCRRQGISLIVADNIEIYENEIHNIEGTLPQTCIDLETGGKDYKIENIKIYNNKLYSASSKRTIQISKNVINLDINNNEINGEINIYNTEEELNIYDNTINDGRIVGYLTLDNVTKDQYYVNKVKIKNNILNNSNIELNRLNNSIVDSNKIINGHIKIIGMNAAIINNQIINPNGQTKEYACFYGTNVDDNKYYTVFSVNNIFEGNFNIKEQKEEKENLIISNNLEETEKYISKYEEI